MFWTRIDVGGFASNTWVRYFCVGNLGDHTLSLVLQTILAVFEGAVPFLGFQE